ncbi:cytochrome P450 [Coprinopsis marcescibilis]|uniref:Cytochrome P450 n=1 Tax=Coprinopsis marcescibilis TaxID=230819 RepID=A0A5C3L9N9_COPMA|nr:cytochrome P450 [Coprinopsis marcescibilis]
MSSSIPVDLPGFATAKQGAVALLVAWTAWKLIARWAMKDPLADVPGPDSKSYISGNLAEFFGPDSFQHQDKVAKEFPGVAKIPGIMMKPWLFIHDPKALYHILLKDQNSFDEPEELLRLNEVTFGKGLLAIHGQKHRKQRKMLNPVFSIAHMREMVPIFYNVGYRLRDSIRQQVSAGKIEINVLSWMSRTALELIGQSGLGTTFDSLEPDSSPHPFYNSLQNLMQGQSKLNIPRFLLYPYVKDLGSPKFRRLVVDALPWNDLHAVRDMIDVMEATSIEIYQRKKRALEQGDEALREQIGQGKDAISILLKANMLASEEDRLTEEELLGQISTLTFAAMDTTSNALSRILQLLAENPEIQTRARKEIISAKQMHGELLYDELVQLPYLDAICRESLRLYPPVSIIVRVATQDAVLPLSRPITSPSGEKISEVTVPSGTQIILGAASSNKDPVLWGPDADEWKPERWLSPFPDSLVEARIPGVYSNLMTFSGGTRSCIGFKFSQLEMKVVLSILLESFQFSPTDKTIKWLFNGITQPSVDEPTASGFAKLQLPLSVSLVA